MTDHPTTDYGPAAHASADSPISHNPALAPSSTAPATRPPTREGCHNKPTGRSADRPTPMTYSPARQTRAHSASPSPRRMERPTQDKSFTEATRHTRCAIEPGHRLCPITHTTPGGTYTDDIAVRTAPTASPPPGRAADVMGAMYTAAQPSPADAAVPAHKHCGWPYPAPNMKGPVAAIYDAALSASRAGAPPPTIAHTTALAIPVWKRETTGHPDDDMIIHGIVHGFPIQYQGPPQLAPAAVYNHQSAVNFPSYIDAYMEQELAQGALSGPYKSPPFTPWFTSSPIMSREKSAGGGRRVIVDLSFPEGGINQHIPPHIFNGKDAVHNLPTVQSAVATIASTPPGDVHLSVIDLSRAYRQFPVAPLDWPLLGMHWRGHWSFDCRIPFGCRMSSFTMQSIAEFLVRALATRSVSAHMYLDDVIIVSATAEIANRDYNTTLQLFSELGLTVATKKLQSPSPVVTWLGIEIDVATNQLTIPSEKLTQIKLCMAVAAERTYITKKHLQRLIGLANHLSKAVRAARIFICRLLATLRAENNDVIRVTPDVRADLAWYARYAATHNGRSIIPNERVVMRVWADACLRGAGASDGARYYEHVFTKPFTDAHHIAQLEGLNCLAAVRVFVDETSAGGTIEVMCDNRPSVDAFTSGRARDPVLAACARALWLHAATAQVDIRFNHIPGESMALPDALSRASLDSAGRARADAFIRRLSLKRARVRGAHFAYKAFL